ncbi:hypothetical protein FE782_18125 [Paenibacillus antri]|uniref:Uncharacterized protein n=1 Tax=Paenibacillus antri TaxID=2582848 RepID=A0A5R9GCT0_9BACL|nr:hypothetical protein [Paenibacillus antri]TLS50964.1 hypothetical protein FE782_18125 [Paenibacillus antri]
MDFYDTWVYREVLNAGWFVRVLVWTILGTNIAMPAIVWFVFSGQPPFKRLRERWKQRSRQTGKA